MGKRERSGTSYNERDFYRDRSSSGPVEKGMPKAKKAPDYKDFQVHKCTPASLKPKPSRAAADTHHTSLSPPTPLLQLFDKKRIDELYDKANAADQKRARALQRATEAGASEAAMAEAQEVPQSEIDDNAECERLEKEGFLDWTRGDFTKYTKGCEKYGRSDYKSIADDIGTKSAEDVESYSVEFWKRGPTYIAEFDKIARRIEDGERKLAEKAKMADALSSKVGSSAQQHSLHLLLSHHSSPATLTHFHHLPPPLPIPSPSGPLVRQPVADPIDQVRQ